MKDFQAIASAVVIAVSEETGVAAEAILGRARWADYVEARHIVAYLLRTDYGPPRPTFEKIGRFLERHHSTVLVAVQKIDRRLRLETVLVEAVARIRTALRSTIASGDCCAIDPRTLDVCGRAPDHSSLHRGECFIWADDGRGGSRYNSSQYRAKLARDPNRNDGRLGSYEHQRRPAEPDPSFDARALSVWPIVEATPGRPHEDKPT